MKSLCRAWNRTPVRRSRAGSAGALCAWLSARPHDVGRADRRDFFAMSRDRPRSSRIRPELSAEATGVPPAGSECGRDARAPVHDGAVRRRSGRAARRSGDREPVVYCGLSMGGYIAFQFWRKYAERLRGLVLCDTRAAADTPEAAAARRVMADRVLAEGPAPLVETMLPRLFCETTRQQRPEVVEGLRRVIMANSPHGIAAAALGMAERPDMTAVAQGDSLSHAGRRRPGRRDFAAGGDARHRRRRFPARSSSRFPPPATCRRWRIPPP